jgi:hypothetical protein
MKFTEILDSLAVEISLASTIADMANLWRPFIDDVSPL